MVRERVKFISDMINCRFEVGDAPIKLHSPLLEKGFEVRVPV